MPTAPTFPSICHACLSFCPEVVSNECLKISQSFEIGGDREISPAVEARGQSHRGGKRRGRDSEPQRVASAPASDAATKVAKPAPTTAAIRNQKQSARA